MCSHRHRVSTAEPGDESSRLGTFCQPVSGVGCGADLPRVSPGQSWNTGRGHWDCQQSRKFPDWGSAGTCQAAASPFGPLMWKGPSQMPTVFLGAH